MLQPQFAAAQSPTQYNNPCAAAKGRWCLAGLRSKRCDGGPGPGGLTWSFPTVPFGGPERGRLHTDRGPTAAQAPLHA